MEKNQKWGICREDKQSTYTIARDIAWIVAAWKRRGELEELY